MTHWSVPLEGGPYDLDCLATRTWVDADVQGESGKEWLLTSPTFEHLTTSADVHRAATALLRRLNQAAHLDDPRYQPCRMIDRVFNGSGPERKGTSFGFAEFRSDTRATVGDDPPPPTLAERAYALAPNHKAVDDALRALSEDDWVGWCKVLEIVRHEKIDPVGEGIVGAAELNRFRHTANHPDAAGDRARHARSKQRPPTNPMSEYQAKGVAGRLIECLVRHFESQP